MSNYLQMATEELYAAHQENQPTMAISRILRVIDDLIHYLKSAPTPELQHRHLMTPATKDKTYLWCPACLEQAESLQSAERPATTASPTTDDLWDAEGSILLRTVESWLSARGTMESLVGMLFKYAELRAALPDDARILALAALARSSTSVSPASSPPAETSQSAAAMSRSASSDWQDFYSPEMGFYVCRDTGEDTPSTPCFYMANGLDAWHLEQLLNRAVLSDLPLEVS